MKNFTLLILCLGSFFLSLSLGAQETSKQEKRNVGHRCTTMEALEEALKKDPSLEQKWALAGQEQWNNYVKRQQDGTFLRVEANEIIIPVVFHIVDVASVQNGITDRDIYEQVEILNRDFSGSKLDAYKNVIPPEIIARLGRVPVRFVLAKRTPGGALTSGIERRTGTTPGRVDIKSFATGGLDAWDTNRYLNVWTGTFSGADAGLLGIATFPWVTTEGPQGVVIGSATLPLAGVGSRGYLALYSEGATLSHEIGHYLYLWHTYGDQAACNNTDFRIQTGWPLPNGAGPEGDDTPEEGASPKGIDIRFGNPSMNYNDGCTTAPFGIMYGSFMNYYDDRALFMFSDGHRKRVEGCIDAYRPGLKTSNGATPPSAITDAHLVNVTPRGTIERFSFVSDNSPVTATIRNSGTLTLTSVTVNVSVDGGAATPTTFPLNLSAGRDTTLNLPNLAAAAGSRLVTVFLSAPLPGTDAFLNNDTIQSAVNISATPIVVSSSSPFTEDFSSTTFPGTKFRIFNPNGGTTALWTRDATSGFTAAGSASFKNFNINQPGTLDELVSVPLDFGVNDSAALNFNVAYTVYATGADSTDVSTWDGLEVYVSGDGGVTYTLAYKKTGKHLQTAAAAQSGSFSATPLQPERWRNEKINLSPYLTPGKKLLIKFRNTNAFGNNLFVDNINVTAAVRPKVELVSVRLNNLPDFTCTNTVTPSVTVTNIGSDPVTSFRLTYILDNNAPVSSTVNTVVGPSQTVTVPLPVINLTPGNHILTVIANFPNGTADPVAANDTLRKAIVVFPTVNLPLVERFEGKDTAANGLPLGWAINNPDGLQTWRKIKVSSKKISPTDSMSVYMRNFTYPGSDQRDDIYTPRLNFSGADSVYVKFDVAASTFNYPGSTALPGDTLEVLITRDCGVTLQSVYKKWGAELQSLRSPNDPNNSEFYPGFNSLWRTDSIYLSPYVGPSGTFQLIFRNTHNAFGNNVFLDNINVFTEVLPQTLKQQGYLILPTTFTNRFNVWHYNQPTDLTGINVYNSVGQLVWSKKYSGNADRTVSVDLGGKAAGIYFVNLTYTDNNRNVVEKVFKY